MQSRIVSQPFLVRNGAVVETRANVSENALLMAIHVLYSSRLLVSVFMSTADKFSSRADVRCGEVQRYACMM